MSNRKILLTFFIFGLGLFLLGIGVGRGSIKIPQNETLGEKSASPIPSSTSESVQGLEIPQNLYKVLKVIDGDTIDIEINGKKENIRLIGIDAPESGQCFGNESTSKAHKLLSSQVIVLEKDPSQDERDRYGRLLGYIFLSDGTNIQELMIREGFVREYTYSKPYKYQSLFKNAQVEAQNNKRGLWQDGACSIPTIEPKPSGSVQNNVQGSYTCDCSKLCGQIQTCDEAYFQLNNCSCTKRDSDKDGVPCESLCR